MKFEVGDLVVLKGGGPRLTITSTGGDESVEGSRFADFGVAWFCGGELREATLPGAALEAFHEEPRPNEAVNGASESRDVPIATSGFPAGRYQVLGGLITTWEIPRTMEDDSARAIEVLRGPMGDKS